MNSLISIAVPVRNGENFLEQCLESVRTANRGRFEVVVSNNFSTDGTAAILERFQALMPELRVVETPRDFGPSENFNYVAQHCSGKWVKFLCHDDLLLPNAIDYIEAALGLATERSALLGNEDVHLFKSGYQMEPSVPFDSPLRAEVFNGLDYLESTIHGSTQVPNISTACVKREVFEQIGGFDRKWLHMDTFLWHKILLDHDYIKISNALGVNRIHGNQITVFVRSANRSMQEHKEYWPTFLDELQTRRKVSWKIKLKLKSKWILVAAYDAAIILRQGRVRECLNVLASTRFFLPAAMPAFLRALVKEKRRVREIESHISTKEIYS